METKLINKYSLLYAKDVLGKKKFKKDKKAVSEIRSHFAAGAILTNHNSIKLREDYQWRNGQYL